MALNKAVYQVLIFLSVPEIFAVKVESCPKSRRILAILPSQILRGRCSKLLVFALLASPSVTSRGKVL